MFSYPFNVYTHVGCFTQFLKSNQVGDTPLPLSHTLIKPIYGFSHNPYQYSSKHVGNFCPDVGVQVF